MQSLFLEYICICIRIDVALERWRRGEVGWWERKERGGVRGDWEGGGDAWGMWDWDLIGIGILCGVDVDGVCHVCDAGCT